MKTKPDDALKVEKATKKRGKLKSDDVEQKEAVEKRASRFKSRPNQDTYPRIQRALSQRMYLISQEDKSTALDGLQKEFAVLGSTGNFYNVTIGRRPNCNCPDSSKGNLCKHVIFVLLRVLRVAQDSELVYQSALLQSELKQIFENAPAQSTVMARKEVVSAFQKIQGKFEEIEAETKIEENAIIEGECPICFEMLTATEANERCITCRNYLHADCLKQWLKRSETCCYCRSDWPKSTVGSVQAGGLGGTVNEEGYLNFGNIQGMSQRRDDSSYNNRYPYGGYYGYYGGKKRYKNQYDY